MYFRPVGVGMGMRPHRSLGLRVSGLLGGGQWVWDVCRCLSGEWYWIESGSVPGVNWSTWWLQEKGNGRKKCFSAYITFLSDSVVQCWWSIKTLHRTKYAVFLHDTENWCYMRMASFSGSALSVPQIVWEAVLVKNTLKRSREFGSGFKCQKYWVCFSPQHCLQGDFLPGLQSWQFATRWQALTSFSLCCVHVSMLPQSHGSCLVKRRLYSSLEFLDFIRYTLKKKSSCVHVLLN